MAAALSAGDLAEAMSRANNSAQLAGVSMDQYIGYLTTVQDITQRSAESVGEAFKTVFARLGNVKVGKYTASIEDMQSADYNEEEYESLNDIETVLDSIGIKLKENATTYRETEDVLDEIAEKWETLDKTTQNALTTALAGTRQREIILTLFENWDQVGNFASIAENSYGTAEKKMEAFTDSVDAARNRITVATEQWALFLDGSKALKDFYNALAFGIKNIDDFVLAIGSILLILNYGKVFNGLTNTFVKLSNAGNNLALLFDNIKLNNKNNIGNSNALDSAKMKITNEYLNNLQETYGKKLQISIMGLDELTQAQALTTQNMLLKLKAEQQQLYFDLTENNLSEEEIQTKLNGITAEARRNVLNILMNETDDKVIKEKLRQIIATEDATINEQNLGTVTESLIKARQKAYYQAIKTNTAEYNKQANIDEKGISKTALTGVGTGLGSMASMIAFGSIGSEIGSQWGDSGKIYGSMIGSIAGPIISKSIASTLAPAISSVAPAIGTVLGGPIGGAIIGGVALAGTTIYNVFKANQKKALEDAAKEFEDSSAKLTSYKNTLNYATTYDDLSKGVDSLGRNISLTEEEYQKFIDANNALAEVFPELIKYTDESGNKMIGLSEGYNTLTDAVKDYIVEQQHLTDLDLLNNNLFEENYQKTKKNIDEITSLKESYEIISRLGFEPIESKLNKGKYDLVTGGNSDVLNAYKKIFEENNIEYSTPLIGNNVITISEEDIEKAKNAIENYKEVIESEYKNAIPELQDEIQAIFREMEYSGLYEDVFNNMSDEVKFMIQNSITNMIPTAENAEDFKKEVENLILKLGEAFNSENGQLALELSLKLNEANSQQEVNELRRQLLEQLLLAFGSDNVVDDTEMKILINLGFETKEGKSNSLNPEDYTDMQNYAQRMQSEFNIKDGSELDTFLKSLSQNEIKKAFELFNQGIVDAETNIEDLSNLIHQDMLGDSVKDLLSKYESIINAMPDYANRVSNYLSEILKTGENTVNNVAESFSDLPENIRNGIQSSGDELLEAWNELGENTQEILNEKMEDGLSLKEAAYESGDEAAIEFAESFEEKVNAELENLDLNALNLNKEILGMENQSIFADVEIDGIIDSYSELKATLDSVANSYEQLKSAQEEQNTAGKLSWQTALGLLESNARYAEALDFTTGSIKLKSNAEEIMAKIQLEAVSANLEAAIAEQKQAIVTAQNELAQLSMGDTVVETTNTKMVATEQEIESLNKLNDAYATNSAIMLANAKAKQATIDPSYIGEAEAAVNGANQVVTSAHVDYKANTITHTYSEQERLARIAELTKMVGSFDQDEGTFSGGYLDDTLKVYEEAKEAIDEMISNGDFSYENFKNMYLPPDDSDSSKKKGGSGGDDEIEKATDYLDKLKELHGLIDKEWEAMLAYDETTKTWRETDYFDKMRVSILAQLTEIDRLLANANQYIAEGKMEESDIISLQKDKIDLQKELNNLDDEEIEDKISLLETQEASYKALIEAQKNLIESADTQEELVERQKELNDLIREERDYRREINSYERDMAERAGKYVSGQAYSNSQVYDTFMNVRQQTLERDLELALQDYNDAFNEAYQQYISEVDSQGNRLWTNAEAYQMAQRSDNAREAMESYFNTLEEMGDLVVERFEAKIDELDVRLDEIEMTKPEEWGSLSSIQPYYNQTIEVLEEKVKEIQEALKNTEGMTDEQIQEWVNKYNEAIQALKQAQEDALQDTIDYQDNQFNALVDWIEEQKENIEDLKDEVQDYYDDLIDDLEKENDARDRTNELIELQQNLLNAQNEKQRVYREGIGWVYESPRNKIKEAQKDLDDFYLQDQIDDLQDTADKEQEILDDRLEKWDLYLKALQYKHDEYERIERDRLLMELLNVNSEQEIHDAIIADWTEFNLNCDGQYKIYNGLFTNFLDEYTLNLQRLAELQRQQLAIMSSMSQLGANNLLGGIGIGISGSGNLASASGMSAKDQAELEAAGKAWNEANAAGDKAGMDAAHKWAESIRDKYGYSGGNDGSGYIPLGTNSYKKLMTDASKIEDDRISDFDNFSNDLYNSYEYLQEIEQYRLDNEANNLLSHGENLANQQTTNENSINDWTIYNENSKIQYDMQTEAFGNFLSDYANQISQYASLQSELSSLMSSGSFSMSGSGGGSSSSGGWGSGGGAMRNPSREDHEDVDLSGYPDKPSQDIFDDDWKDYIDSGGSAPGWSGNSSAANNGGSTGVTNPDGSWSPFPGGPVYKKSYANGLKNGPVTYTGLAMLHGTPNNPEYVLNNDQAYNLLYNLSGIKMSEFESNKSESNNTIYNLNGDINLSGVDNPAEFWDAVLKQASGRWNITKNK